MKTKRADFVYKIFFIVAGVILSGLLIAWLAGTYKDKKKEADAGTQKINSITSSMADFDLTVYDGGAIKGEALRDLISAIKDKGKDAQISVWVYTLDGKDIEYIYDIEEDKEKGKYTLGNTNDNMPGSKKSESGYITPTGNFIGEVLRNENDEIVGLKFTQQK